MASHVSRILLSLVVLAATAACNRSQAQPPPAGAQLRPTAVTTARAEARAVQRAIETSGSLAAWDEVVAKSEQPGTVARLRVDLGDRVAAGAVLAEYDRREFQLAVDQAQADLSATRELLARAGANATATEAQLRRVRDTLTTLEADVARAQSQLDWAAAELERAKRLFAKDLIAARDVDNARNQYNIAAAQLTQAKMAVTQHPDQMRAAEAQLLSDQAAVKNAAALVRQREAAFGLAQKRLGDTTVRAPIAGLVAKRHLSAGEFVKENTALFTLVVANPLKYVGTVPERRAPELREGQTVRLTVEAYGDKAFIGAVTRLAPAVDVQTRTLVLEARVPNHDGALRPGFFAKGSVLTRQDPAAVFVPGESVTSIAGITKVFVVADGKALERLVKLGARQGTWVEIADGVKAGETVATSNLAALFDGAPVEPPRGR
ncbi:MAG: efflux RND transporter periplasmic adaptor subunit [candidate division NC10 bacterium]